MPRQCCESEVQEKGYHCSLGQSFFFFANEEGTDVFVCVGKREATVAWRVQATREVSL